MLSCVKAGRSVISAPVGRLYPLNVYKGWVPHKRTLRSHALIAVRTTSDDPGHAMARDPRSVQRAIDAIEAAGGLVTPREIAQEWGVSDQAIADRIQRGTFPEPLKVAGRVRLYLRAQVDGLRDPD